MNIDANIKVEEMILFDVVNQFEEIGKMILRIGEKLISRSIWFGEDDEHYICLEDEDGDLEVILISDLH
jgi:hypothetical protein